MVFVSDANILHCVEFVLGFRFMISKTLYVAMVPSPQIHKHMCFVMFSVQIVKIVCFVMFSVQVVKHHVFCNGFRLRVCER